MSVRLAWRSSARARRRCAGQMPVQPAHDQVGVVLGDVVEVVGDAAPHIVARIVLQRASSGSVGDGSAHQRLQPQAPGQARPAAFADQAAHLRAGVGAQRCRVSKTRCGWRTMKGRIANSAVKRCVSACSAASARSGWPGRGARRTRRRATGSSRADRRVRSPGAASEASGWGGASAASMTSAAASKSAGSVASSAAHICIARAFSSSVSRPSQASACEAFAVEARPGTLQGPRPRRAPAPG